MTPTNKNNLLWALLPALIFLSAAFATAQTNPTLSACELQASLKKLSVTGTVMYIAAHPDDENSSLLAYFANERHYRTIYLSVTRGEGGQNLLGAEKGADLGVVRTEELLAARRMDGGEQLFTRAIDFGFSKTPVETIAMWQKDSVIADIVWAIRTTRPDVIITRFSPTEGGHGNHTASAILAEAAYACSGDASAYPEQLRYVKPWKAKRLFFNRLTGFDDRKVVKEAAEKLIDTGIFNPLLGRSYTEIAGLSRSLHKTQAMGSLQRRGPKPELFRLTREAGDAGTGDDVFSGIETSWKRYRGGEEVDRLLAKADHDFDAMHPDAIVPLLLQAHKQITAIAAREGVKDPVLALKEKEIVTVITSALGMRFDMLTSSADVLPGRTLQVDAEIIQRSTTLPVTIDAITAPLLGIDSQLHTAMQSNAVTRVSLAASLPSSMRSTQPYWLQAPPDKFLYRVPSQLYVGLPENPDSLAVTVSMSVGGEKLAMSVPVRFRKIDPIAGEVYRPVVILPAIEVSIEQKNLLWTHPEKKQIAVRLSLNDTSFTGELMLVTPAGFHVQPASIPVAMTRETKERTFMFDADADTSAAAGYITAVALVHDPKRPSSSTKFDISTALAWQQSGHWMQNGAEISYPHIVPQYVMHTAQLMAMRADIRIVKSRIGYVMGSGDEVPAALRLCGYDVTLLEDDSLQSGMLAQYDAIVVGGRAYNVRERLRKSNARLMDFVRQGGTVVVQYQTPGKDVEDIGPYPFHISRDRVTDENAEMQITTSNVVRELMTAPNRLTIGDLSGWVQERGLYFAEKWNSAYEAPFTCHDPNEAASSGSLIACAYGKGVYVYTGLSFFRQLPAGVTGAFRLFSNIIELTQRR